MGFENQNITFGMVVKSETAKRAAAATLLPNSTYDFFVKDLEHTAVMQNGKRHIIQWSEKIAI